LKFSVVEEEKHKRRQVLTVEDGAAMLSRTSPDYASGTQIGQAFEPAAEAWSFLPFFKVMTARKMSL